jgi:hypothetical protein
MTKTLDSGTYTALQDNRLVSRDFVWFIVRDRSTGGPVTDGYWSDVGTISAQVIDPATGGTVTRQFFGADGLISVSDIPLVSTLNVQTITVELAQASARVNDLVRTYDCKQGVVQIFRGLFDPDTRAQVGPAYPRFYGTIDEAPITTPAENDSGNVTLTCTSNTQELMRSNSDTRSDASQRQRSATDNFYQDTAVVGLWQHFWGRAGGTVRSSASGGGQSLSSLFQGLPR